MISRLFNNNTIKLLLIITIIVTLGMEWDRPLGFSNTEDLRIDQSGLYTIIHFYSNNFNNGNIHLGTDLIFPYGPMLYMKYGLYWPGLYNFGIACKLLFLVSLGLQLNILLKINNKNNYKKILPLMVLTIYILWQRDDAPFTIYYIILGYIYFINKNNLKIVESLILMSSASLIALIKFPFFIIFFWLIFFVFLCNFFKKLSQLPVLFGLMSFLFIWIILCHQKIIDLIPYIRGSYEQARYFSDNMQIGWISEWDTASQVLIFIITIIYLITINLSHFCKKPDNSRYLNIFFIIFYLAILFIIFKHGVVRHDGHAGDTALTFLYLLVFSFMLLDLKKLNAVPKYICFTLIILNFTIFNYWHVRGADKYVFVIKPIEIYQKITKALIAPFRAYDHEEITKKVFETNVQKFKSEVGIYLPGKTIDVWPDNSALAIFSDSIYTPRPMPFAFSSYSHYLTEKNARFFGGPNAPEYLIFDVKTIDGRMPTMDDPLSWIAIYNNYNFEEIINKRAILRKRDHTRTGKMLATVSLPGKFNDSIALPKDITENLVFGDYISCKVNIKKSFFGKLVSIFYKIPPLMLEIEESDGNKKWFRLLLSEDGFIIDPIINDLQSGLALISEKYNKKNTVISIKVINNYSIKYFNENFNVVFSKLNIGK